MNTLSKIATGVLFLLPGLLPLFFHVSFQVQQGYIRQKMKARLNTGSLQTIVIEQEKVVWMDGHEIWVNGMMFDIQSMKLENGVYTFSGLYDYEETLLVLKQKSKAGNNSETDRLLNRMFLALQQLFLTESAYVLPLPDQTGFANDSFLFILPNPFLGTPVPPPWC